MRQKTEFLRALADWIKLIPQAASELTTTLHAHAVLIDAYQYVITARLQSDPVERRFSQYRQMSGGRFLNNLREVLNSKRILRCRFLIKKNNVTTGYVAKKLIKQSHCESYKTLLKAGDVDIDNDAQLNVLSHGGPFVPSKSLADLLCYSGFRSSVTFVLRCYRPESDFVCDNYLDGGFNFATKITVNIFFNNKQAVRRYCL